MTAPDISLLMQAGLRSLLATGLVAIWILARRETPLLARDRTLAWGVAAGLLFALEFLLIYWALDFTNASRGVIFIYLAPFVVALGSHWFVPGERLSPSQYAGLVVAFLGIVTTFGESLSMPSERMLIGDAMMIGGAVFWGATTVLIKASPLIRIDASRTLIYQLAVSAPLLIAGSWALGEPGVVRWSTFAVSSLVYQSAWVAFITYLVWFWMMKEYSASKLSSFTFITPLFGVVAGWWVLDEPLTPGLLMGAVLVAAGIYLVNRRPRRRQSPAPSIPNRTS